MKAHLVKTDDYETLFLDGVPVEGNHTLTTQDVLEAVLGEENVVAEWIDEGEAYDARVDELIAASKVRASVEGALQEWAQRYFRLHRGYNAARSIMASYDNDMSSAYTAFEKVCRENGIEQVGATLERIRKVYYGDRDC